MEKVTTLVALIVQHVVSKPEYVETHTSFESDDHGELAIINIKVHPEDVGACIGKNGRTAEMLRHLVGIAGYKHAGHRVYVRVDAPKLPKEHYVS